MTSRKTEGPRRLTLSPWCRQAPPERVSLITRPRKGWRFLGHMAACQALTLALLAALALSSWLLAALVSWAASQS